MVDRYQVVEARAAGADAILLIVMALTDDLAIELAGEAARWGLDVVWEAHDAAEEVRRAVAASARIIGINHRDLRTFEVDTTLAVRMRPEVPGSRLVVAESGIKTADDVRGLRDAGINAILVGESLMRAPDPGEALRSLLEPVMKFVIKICGVTRPEDAAFAARPGRGRHRPELLARVQALRRGRPGPGDHRRHPAPRAEDRGVRQRPPAGGHRDAGRAAPGHGPAARGREGGQLERSPPQADRARHPGLRRGLDEGGAGLGSRPSSSTTPTPRRSAGRA